MNADRPSATQKSRRRWRLQCGLLAFLTIVVVCASLSIFRRRETQQKQTVPAAVDSPTQAVKADEPPPGPVQWQTFRRENLNKHLASGSDVLVVYYEHWKPRPLWRLDQPTLRKALRKRGVVPLVANLHYPIDKDGFADVEGMRAELDDLGEDRPRLPLAVLYRRDSARMIFTRFNVGDEIATRVAAEIMH